MSLAPITVAVPAFRTTWLSQCLASVLSQTFGDYELLISDDCPDGSVKEVVAQFSDPRIRLIEGPRQGLVANSLHLWKSARHDFLKYLYDDDFLLPFALAEMRHALARHPAAPLAFARRHIVDPKGKIVLSPEIFPGAKSIQLKEGLLVRSAILTLHSPVGEPSSMLIRRSAFASADCLRFYRGLPVRHLIDVCLLFNSCDVGPTVGIANFLSAFRRHGGQTTEGRDNPAYSAGLFEWELFIRGSIDAGYVSNTVADGAIVKLAEAYEKRAVAFPELHALLPGLLDLRADLEKGGACGITDNFRRDYLAAMAVIDERVAASPA
jgi:glycosyltransferase involved in cell wall biosynthesis